jgi:hypothetical protein
MDILDCWVGGSSVWNDKEKCYDFTNTEITYHMPLDELKSHHDIISKRQTAPTIAFFLEKRIEAVEIVKEFLNRV